MANLPFLVAQYAQDIYLTGKRRFTTRDGVNGISSAYVADVKGYAAKNYYIDDIDNALEKTWINQQEYDETMALKQPGDPQYRPTPLAIPASPQ